MSRLIKYVSLIAALQLILCLGFATQVHAATPTLTLSTSSGKVGDVITISGTNWAGDGTVSITYLIQGSTSSGSSTAVSSGNFTLNFTIPASASGSHNITVTGSDTGAVQVQTFNVVPSIVLGRTSGEPGTSVAVTGSGFGNTETNIILKFNDSNTTVVGTTNQASTTGSWTSTFSVPALSGGSYTITAIGANNLAATATFTIIITPKLFVTPTSGPIGASVTVSGSGFASNESGVTVTFGGATHTYPASVTSSGTWSVTFNVPVMPGGRYTVDASGTTTSGSVVGDQGFTVTPTVTISPTAGPPGSTVSVDGNGFGANESVTISYDSTDVQSGVAADSNGTFSKSITVPIGASGTHKISARGSLTAKTTAASDFKVGAGISINKASGISGTVITVTGSGFAAKETGLNIIFDSVKTATTAVASDTGSWTANFSIPVAAGGDHKIDAEGKSTAATSISDITFTILPDISIDKTDGPVGTSVSLNATGFAAGETGISITYDGKPLGPKITADTKGTWKAAVTIPSSSAGTHTLQVNGTSTDSSAQGNKSFEVSSSMSISPTGGFVGSSINVTGTGFAANSSLHFNFDNSELNAGLATTDNLGSINKTISIPPKVTAGAHVIRVQDSQGHSEEAAFSIDSTPPPLPKIISPSEGQTIGLFGNITPSLEWSKVTDPNNGITYNLQLDSSTDFDNPLIEVSGLTATKYTVKKSDALPRGQYYWRVQAVDGASNASAWTDPVLLVSGKISPAIFILIVIAIVAVLAVGAFFLLRFLRKRRGVSQPQMAPEIVIPEVVNAEYKQIEGDKKALPWRLALPQAPQGARGAKPSISSEDQARLKVIVDFAKSVPLAEPGANTKWLVDLAENTTGTCASPALYSQLVRGELQLRYEPAWMNHPTYMDLQTLLEGQPILQDLNTFIDTVNRTASEAEAALGDIYQQIVTEVRWDIFPNGGWAYISAIYMDSFNWFQGKYLKEPSERDYSIKPEPLATGGDGFGLYAEPNTPFAGLLIQVGEEKDARDLRALHLRLRRDFRNNDRIKVVVTSIIQLEVQRNRLINAFSQFNRLNPIQ